MTPTERTILTIYAVIVAVWPIRHAVLSIIFRSFDYLTLRSPRFSSPDPPLVTALIPAKDEQEHLADCLDSVRAQSYPNLEILVVDDRSTDRTPAIAASAANQDPRVRVHTITDLPPGWTGKTHALHVAAAEARGAWLWFLDADTRHQPDSLSIAMEYGRDRNAQLVSLLPELRCETFWERAMQPLMGIVLMRSYPLHKVNDDRRLKPGFANGQYLLIRRDAYDAAGGHESVRSRFLEDIALAKRVKALGRPIRVAIGTEISSTRMYTSLPQIIRGWSRILYDGLDRNVPLLIGKILEPLLWSQTGGFALIASLVLLALGHDGPFARWMLGLSILHLILQVSVLYRFYRLQSPAVARSAAWYPVAGYVSAWITLKAIVMCFTGRVTWRGTSYNGTSPARAAQPAPADRTP